MKLPGVEAADVSLDKASADIRLKADSRITMPQLREVLKKNGYPTRDAQIEARGKVIQRNGKFVLDLLNDSWLDLTDDPAHASRAGRTVEITGVSRAVGKTPERLTLTGVR